MSRKRKKHRRGKAGAQAKSRPSGAGHSDPPRFVIKEFKISWDPIEGLDERKIPLEIRDHAEELHDLIYDNPAEAVPRLRPLVEKYPDHPTLRNWLGVAYMNSGNTRKSHECIMESYRRNPDYLFAITNYAMLLISKGEFEKAGELFKGNFDLTLIYPDRDTFHITEFTAFNGAAGLYFASIGNIRQAKIYYDALHKLAPDHPMTELLEKRLYPSFLRQAIDHLLADERRLYSRKDAAPDISDATDPPGRYIFFDQEDDAEGKSKD